MSSNSGVECKRTQISTFEHSEGIIEDVIMITVSQTVQTTDRLDRMI